MGFFLSADFSRKISSRRFATSIQDRALWMAVSRLAMTRCGVPQIFGVVMSFCFARTRFTAHCRTTAGTGSAFPLISGMDFGAKRPLSTGARRLLAGESLISASL